MAMFGWIRSEISKLLAVAVVGGLAGAFALVNASSVWESALRVVPQLAAVPSWALVLLAGFAIGVTLAAGIFRGMTFGARHSKAALDLADAVLNAQAQDDAAQTGLEGAQAALRDPQAAQGTAATEAIQANNRVAQAETVLKQAQDAQEKATAETAQAKNRVAQAETALKQAQAAPSGVAAQAAVVVAQAALDREQEAQAKATS